MEVLDHDYTVHHRRYAGDESLLVKFFLAPVKDDAKSLEEGRPIFADMEHIDIRIPGSRDNIVIRPVRPEDLERFPRHYAAWKNRVGAEAALIGTPLETWHYPQLSPARIEELKAMNIRTVEQIAGAPDSVSGRIMGFQSMKQAATVWLEATKSAAPLLDLTEKLNAALAKIEAQGAELIRLAAIADEKKKR